MRRAMMWFNLYGCQTVRCNVKNRLKMHFCSAYFWSYIRHPDHHIPRLNHIVALHINLTYLPKNQSLKFSYKNIENWWIRKTQFLFQVFFFIPIKISHKLRGSMDGAQFFWIPWFLEKIRGDIKLWNTLYLNPLFMYNSIYYQIHL